MEKEAMATKQKKRGGKVRRNLRRKQALSDEVC